MKKLLILLTFITFTNANASSYECVYKYRENGILKSDLFPWSYLEVNNWLKRITFYPYRPSHRSKNDGIKFQTLTFEKARSKNSYKSEIFKQQKLSDTEKKILTKERDYLWEDVKDENLQIWINNANSNPIELQISPVDISNTWIKMYDCYVPRKKK